MKQVGWTKYLGPVFMLFILSSFFITPGTVYDKLNMICFGI
ncbi:MAG: hypothetical protein WCF84_18125 [Anaerolineae bacterium]